MSYVITFDQNSNCIMVFLGDNTKTDGSGKTGLTYNTSGLIIATRADNEASATVYKQADGNIEDISTLGTFAAPTSGKCRFKEVDATNMPGIYEIQLPDARFSVATGMARLRGSITGDRMASGAIINLDLSQKRPAALWSGNS